MLKMQATVKHSRSVIAQDQVPVFELLLGSSSKLFWVPSPADRTPSCIQTTSNIRYGVMGCKKNPNTQPCSCQLAHQQGVAQPTSTVPDTPEHVHSALHRDFLYQTNNACTCKRIYMCMYTASSGIDRTYLQSSFTLLTSTIL